jgi:sporulation integral membrane protein YtvI
MKTVDWQRLASILFCACVGGAMLFLLLRYALPVLLPFFLAFLLSRTVRRPAHALARSLHLPPSLCALALLLALCLLGGTLLWWGLLYLGREAIALAQRLSQDPSLAALLSDAEARLSSFFSRFAFLDDAPRPSSLLYGMLGRIASSLASFLSGVVSGLPTALFFLLVTLVASVYFCLDGEKLTAHLWRLCPKALRERIHAYREGAGRLLRRYLRGYLILFLITLCSLLAGLSLLRVEHALLLSLLFSLADLLPIVGIGTVLIPWGLLCLATGERAMGISLLVLYLAVSVVRQLAEPKILGKSLGIHPLLSLLCSYAGLSLFGVWGLLFSPLAALLCKSVQAFKKSEDASSR